VVSRRLRTCLLLPHLAVPEAVAYSAQQFGGSKIFNFRLATVFCLEYRLSKYKTTGYFQKLGRHGSLGPPGYAYVPKQSTTARL